LRSFLMLLNDLPIYGNRKLRTYKRSTKGA
jgi:hypothetical protein